MPRRNQKARRRSTRALIVRNIPTGPAPTYEQMAGDLVARGLAPKEILSPRPAPRGPARDARSGQIKHREDAR